MEKQSRFEGRNKSADFAAFVSHAKADQKKAQDIVASLEERGFKCWIAPRDVRPGHTYGDEIITGIERSRCFILALSGASNESAFVAREVERAVSKEKPIFTIRVEAVEPSSALELFISNTQWIDAFSNRCGPQIDRLASLLAMEEGEPGRVSGNQALVSSGRFGGWGRPAGFALAVLLLGLGGALLWSFHWQKPESLPLSSAARSTAEPGFAVVTPPAEPTAPSAEPNLVRLPEPVPTDAPRPRSAKESCSRSGDTMLCTSSVLPPGHGNAYGSRNLTDGDNGTAWVEGSDGQGLGDFVVFEFDSVRTVRGLTLRNGYGKNPDIFSKNSRVKDIELRFSTGDSLELTLKDEPDAQHVELSRPVKAKWVELIIRSVYPGSKYSDTAINELSVDAQ